MFSKSNLGDWTDSTGTCVIVTRLRDNQVAIAKKRGDMLLPTLRTDHEHASSHLRGLG